MDRVPAEPRPALLLAHWHAQRPACREQARAWNLTPKAMLANSFTGFSPSASSLVRARPCWMPLSCLCLQGSVLTSPLCPGGAARAGRKGWAAGWAEFLPIRLELCHPPCSRSQPDYSQLGDGSASWPASAFPTLPRLSGAQLGWLTRGPWREWPSWTAGPGNGGQRNTLISGQLPRENPAVGSSSAQACPRLRAGPVSLPRQNRKQNLNQGVV